MRIPVVISVFCWSFAALADTEPPGDQAPPADAAPPPAPGTAAAAPSLEPDAVPEPCRELAKLATSPSKNAALSARISLASCLADQAIRPLVLCDCEHSVRELDAAIAPSLSLLDQVFMAGDATMQILARHAQGELLANLVTRMLATVPPASDAGATPEASALRQTRLELLQPLLEPWRVQARAALTELDRIAKENPQLAKNQAVAHAVRTSRARMTGVARR